MGIAPNGGRTRCRAGNNAPVFYIQTATIGGGATAHLVTERTRRVGR